jgi:hypothetical protein
VQRLPLCSSRVRLSILDNQPSRVETGQSDSSTVPLDLRDLDLPRVGVYTRRLGLRFHRRRAIRLDNEKIPQRQKQLDSEVSPSKRRSVSHFESRARAFRNPVVSSPSLNRSCLDGVVTKHVREFASCFDMVDMSTSDTYFFDSRQGAAQRPRSSNDPSNKNHYPQMPSPRSPASSEPTIRALSRTDSNEPVPSGQLSPKHPYGVVSYAGSTTNRRLCAKCGQAVSDKFVRAMDKKFHLDCFRCQVHCSLIFPWHCVLTV